MLESAKRRDRVGLRIDSSRAPVRHFTADGRLLHVDYYAKIALGDVVQRYDTGPEFRPATEVCDPESVASWKGLIFVDEHPDDGVDADNAARLARGLVLDAWAEEPDVAATLRVNDARTIERIDGGKQGLSGGYDLAIAETPGEFKGVPYQRVQKTIRGNHVALTYNPRGQRDGEKPRIYMDSRSPLKPGDRVRILADHMPELVGAEVTVEEVGEEPYYAVRLPDGRLHKWFARSELEALNPAQVGIQKDEDMKKIKLPDGQEVEVPEAVAALIESLQAQLKPPEGAPAAEGDGAPAPAPAAPAAPGQSRPPGEPPKMDSLADHLRARVAVEQRLDQVEKQLDRRFAEERARSRADSLAYGAFQAEAAPVLAAAGKSIAYTGDLVADRLAVAEQLLGADDNDVKAARAALKKRADSGEASGEATGLALGLYRTALAEHRRRHDSTGEQIAGLTHRADSAGDDDVLGALTSQYGGTATKAKA